MFILKLGVGVACIYLCCKIAITKASVVKENYLFWESAVSLCNYLLQEFSYKKRPLLGFGDKNYTSSDFKILLNCFLNNKEVNYPKYLSDCEIVKLTTFFNEIGKSDSETQKIAINSYKNDFESILIDKKAEYKKTYSVTLKVGFSMGIMMLVMVI